MRITIDDFRNVGFGAGLLGGIPLWIQTFGEIGFVGIIVCCLIGGVLGHIIGIMVLGVGVSVLGKSPGENRSMTKAEWKKKSRE